MQYVHGIFTQLAHRMHQPQDEPLHDVGFDLTPVSVLSVVEVSSLNRKCHSGLNLLGIMQELGPDQHWVSEAVFGTAFAVFVLWTFSPFVMQRKRFYTAVMWSRLLMVLVGE